LAKKESRFICFIDTAQPVELVMRRHAVLAATLACFFGIESAEAKLDILVDKTTQRMMVMQDGYIRYMWPVSTGRDELATPSGIYHPQRLERNWFSSAYYNSPMPYSIFFYNGYAIHGSYAIDKLGGPASHGCVRLHPHHAELLFDLVQQERPENTTIEVTDEPRPEEPPMPAREVPLSGREIPALSGREIAAAQGPYLPAPKIIRYREPMDMAELAPAQRGGRSIVAKPASPPRPPPARRMFSDARPPANVPRPTGGAGPPDTANSPRPPGEASESRPRAKLAEAPPAEQAQQMQSAYGFKLLPTSCWTGGASRWRWWASGSQGTPCK
jgi:hypothetical protein